MISVWTSSWGISHPRSSVVVSVFSSRDLITWYLGSEPQILMVSFQLPPLQIWRYGWGDILFITWKGHMKSYEVIWGHRGHSARLSRSFSVSFERYWTHFKIDFLALNDPEWPQMTSYDLPRWKIKYLFNQSPKSVMVVVKNSPSQFGALNLNITWWGHVTKKPTSPLNSFGAKYPIKRLKLISWELSKIHDLQRIYSNYYR